MPERQSMILDAASMSKMPEDVFGVRQNMRDTLAGAGNEAKSE